MIYFQLFKEFFLTGLLAFGGGFATLPFLYRISEVYHWFSTSEISQMVAIATITPGPIGLNMATYTGMKVGGVFPAIITTFALVLPALIIVILFSKLLEKYRDNFYTKAILYSLKPASCALLSSVLIKLTINNVKDLYDTILLGVLFFIAFIKNKSVIFCLLFSVVVGLLAGIIIKV